MTETGMSLCFKELIDPPSWYIIDAQNMSTEKQKSVNLSNPTYIKSHLNLGIDNGY